jgi:hypothetical protein
MNFASIPTVFVRIPVLTARIASWDLGAAMMKKRSCGSAGHSARVHMHSPAVPNSPPYATIYATRQLQRHRFFTRRRGQARQADESGI